MHRTRARAWRAVHDTRSLEEKGLVTSKYSDPTPERGGRAKRYFTVTARGVRGVARAQRAYQRLLKGLVLPGGAHA
jgi:DNA-binding PadR family transcriptional regulator